MKQRRPRQCHNCGGWFVWAFKGQDVCCVWSGPRWIDDPQAYDDAVQHKEWFEGLPEKSAYAENLR